VVIERAVHGRREAHEAGPYPAFGEGDHFGLHRGSRPGLDRVGFGPGALHSAEHQHQRARVTDERLAGPGERVTHRLLGAQVGFDRSGDVSRLHLLVLEGQVDDPIRGRRGVPQAAEIVEGAPVRLGPEGLHGRGGCVGTGQADDSVPGAEEFGDDGRSDVAGRSGDEDLHGNYLLLMTTDVGTSNKVSNVN
jgi:hypothetical protein